MERSVSPIITVLGVTVFYGILDVNYKFFGIITP